MCLLVHVSAEGRSGPSQAAPHVMYVSEACDSFVLRALHVEDVFARLPAPAAAASLDVTLELALLKPAGVEDPVAAVTASGIGNVCALCAHVSCDGDGNGDRDGGAGTSASPAHSSAVGGLATAAPPSSRRVRKRPAWQVKRRATGEVAIMHKDAHPSPMPPEGSSGAALLPLRPVPADCREVLAALPCTDLTSLLKLRKSYKARVPLPASFLASTGTGASPSLPWQRLSQDLAATPYTHAREQRFHGLDYHFDDAAMEKVRWLCGVPGVACHTDPSHSGASLQLEPRCRRKQRCTHRRLGRPQVGVPRWT